MAETPYTTEADKLISDIRSFQDPNIPTPAPTIPGFTGFGDRLATIGGFGDDPNELKTQEELAKMTQAQIDAYTKQRKMARRSGMSEALMQFGEALQGKPAAKNAAARQEIKDQKKRNKMLDEVIKKSTNITNERKNYLYTLPYASKANAFLEFAQPEDVKQTQAIKDYEYYSQLDETERLKFAAASGRGAYNEAAIELRRRAASEGGLDLSPGEKKKDQAYADKWVAWTGGEKQQAESNIQNLENKIAILGKGANVSGPEYAFIPENLMPVVAPGSTGFKDEISDIVFQSLRSTLGAQFTQREAERLIDATFNQNLPEDMNLPRLQRLLAKTKAIYNDKQKEADFYNTEGTLKGYVRDTPTFNDLLDSIFFDELKQLTNEQISKRYIDAPTTEERLSILRYAQSLQQTGE